MKAGEPTDLQDRVLERLQTKGPATAGSLAKALGVAEELVLSYQRYFAAGGGGLCSSTRNFAGQ
jgi:hypothetical protein